MDIGEIRQRNFRHLINQLEADGVTKRRDQGEKLGGFLSASYVSQLLAGKYIGDEVASKICEALGLQRGWMDRPQWPGSTEYDVRDAHAPAKSPYVRVQQLDAEADMGDGRVNADYPEVIHSIDFTPAYIRSIVGFVPQPGRLVLVTGRGDSMIPIIQPGESLIVDTGISTFDGDGIYLINTGNGQQIKGLQDRGDAIYVVSANTVLYPAFPLPRGALVGGKVHLRTRIDRLN